MEANPTQKSTKKSCCGSSDCQENEEKCSRNQKSGTKVTVICGLESSGKTTLINSILNQKDEKIGIIWNGMKKKKSGTGHFQLKGRHELFELPRGCACCSLYDEFIQSFKTFKGKKQVDRVIVEAASVVDVNQIGETISFGDQDENGTLLSKDFNLDAIVTLVDVSTFFNNLNKVQYLIDLKINVDKEDFRNLPSVLIEQIEHADILVLTKIDLASEVELEKVKSFIKLLNPTSTILLSNKGDISADALLNTDLYDFEKTQMKPGWLKVIRDESSDMENTKEYGFFVFRARKPFHPKRLWDLIDKSDELLPGVMRSRGFAWLASKNDFCGEWFSSGNLYTIQGSSLWFIKIDKENWPKDDPKFLDDFVEPYGDRRQEIAFMGMNMDEGNLRRTLEECLLTEEEMKLGEEEWKKFEDKFEGWELDELDSPDYGEEGGDEEEGEE